MIYWYEFSLVYLVSGTMLVLENKVYSIIPPKTRMGWVVLALNVILLVTMWWFILEPFNNYELNPSQQNHLLLGVLTEFPMNYFLFRPFLEE